MLRTILQSKGNAIILRQERVVQLWLRNLIRDKRKNTQFGVDPREENLQFTQEGHL